MAAKRCSTCGINYPPGRLDPCSVCEETLSYMGSATVDQDWAELVRLTQAAAPDETSRVEAWRREELERAGYTVEQVDVLAPRADVDLHLAVALITTRGCSREVAFDILS